MPIMIELEERHQRGLSDVYCPVIYCDYCGKRIMKANQGIYEYSGKVGGAPMEVVFLHARGDGRHCYLAWEKSHPNLEGPLGPDHRPWDTLEYFLPMLVNNMWLNQEHINWIARENEVDRQ